MINMFSQMVCICHFVSLCPAQSLLWVYPVWVHSQCSLHVLGILFQLFRCRNLALNRFFPTFHRGRHVLYLWGVWMPPYIHIPPWHPHMFKHPLYVLYASVCSRGYLHVIWGCGPPYVGHPHKGEWMPPPCVQHLHVLYASLYICIF